MLYSLLTVDFCTYLQDDCYILQRFSYSPTSLLEDVEVNECLTRLATRKTSEIALLYYFP
jgi:hypothetical protein